MFIVARTPPSSRRGAVHQKEDNELVPQASLRCPRRCQESDIKLHRHLLCRLVTQPKGRLESSVHDNCREGVTGRFDKTPTLADEVLVKSMTN